MTKILLYPTYFPSIVQMIAVVKAEEVVFEINDNYQKQTYRNRTYIAHNNGKLLLNIPIKHTKDGERQKTADVVIENDFPWQLHHWKSLQTAYRTSPFFEFYEDDLMPIFKTPASSLLKLNFQIFEMLQELIGFSTDYSNTETYQKTPDFLDLRLLCDVRKAKKFVMEPYTQVLEANHGFLPNLSVLDLLFNEGPNTLNYLESQSFKFE
ncbi:WbqC family protein [Ulvibacter antarcticus]|uniref:WbqC-like protein n=1 Tax=Ulvibacter antarcticus TaxID=442714 RepID=A0A3L9YYG8_9FLAO|nr:WbqC family protein [Ulvibacter antarcticus]RMA64847.1 WbqC-like protein [Ulvibacter antarcticus]